MAFPMDRKVVTQKPVAIEYTARGKRVRKTLPNALAARAFYLRKDREDKQPAIMLGIPWPGK
jgi:hypothetical protein